MALNRAGARDVTQTATAEEETLGGRRKKKEKKEREKKKKQEKAHLLCLLSGRGEHAERTLITPHV